MARMDNSYIVAEVHRRPTALSAHDKLRKASCRMTNGSDLPRRVQRVEEFVEVLANEHIQLEQEFKRLLTAQVVMQDSMKPAHRRDGKAG